MRRIRLVPREVSKFGLIEKLGTDRTLDWRVFSMVKRVVGDKIIIMSYEHIGKKKTRSKKIYIARTKNESHGHRCDDGDGMMGESS